MTAHAEFSHLIHYIEIEHQAGRVLNSFALECRLVTLAYLNFAYGTLAAREQRLMKKSGSTDRVYVILAEELRTATDDLRRFAATSPNEGLTHRLEVLLDELPLDEAANLLRNLFQSELVISRAARDRLGAA